MKPIKNPLDDLFDISDEEIADQNEMDSYDEAPASEIMAAQQASASTVVEKDEEDIENDARFDEVYTAAKDAFDNQMAYTEIIEPRYAARNAEVAANFLNLALQAASAKARVKSDRKRATAFIPGMGAGSKVTNNTIVATREEILRMISVDADHKEIK
jgi:hypothetical protein